MYSKFVAILINSAFGLCITYTVFSVYFALTSKFIVERSFILGFSLYNIVWLVLDIVYNEARYHRQGGGLFFWTRSEERRVGKECRSRWSPYH